MIDGKRAVAEKRLGPAGSTASSAIFHAASASMSVGRLVGRRCALVVIASMCLCAMAVKMPRKASWALAVAMLFLASIGHAPLAHALVVPSAFEYQTVDWSSNLWSRSPQEACDRALRYLNASGSSATPFECSDTAFHINRVRADGTVDLDYAATAMARRLAQCPANSRPHQFVQNSCECNPGFQDDPSRTFCVAAAIHRAASAACRRPAGLSFGHPILAATREKFRSEQDWIDSGPSPLAMVRTYRSTWAAETSHLGAGLGTVWTHGNDLTFKAVPAAAPTGITISRPEGSARTFARPSGATTWTATNSADKLTQAGGDGWIYHRADDDTTFDFDASGKLRTQVSRNGWTTTFAYHSSGQLASVTNPFNRTLGFTYGPAGQLLAVTTPDARAIRYGYDAMDRLSTVTYPDGKMRGFVYENAAFPQALTGIVDETGARWESFAYDAQGRAISTELAGSADRYQVSYPSSNSALVIDPLGTSRTYNYSTIKGKLAVTGGSLPSGTDESDAASRAQDANGLITSETDFKGVTTTTTWDAGRQLPTTVTRAVGTPEAQTVTTQWHPTFSLPVLVTEAGRTIAYAHDDKGNVLSQAITDTASSPNSTRTWSWTWNIQGLAATETAPNGAVTTFEYDTLGNLVKSTNALGHVTLYAYDSANRVIGTTAPNGVVIGRDVGFIDSVEAEAVDLLAHPARLALDIARGTRSSAYRLLKVLDHAHRRS